MITSSEPTYLSGTKYPSVTDRIELPFSRPHASVIFSIFAKSFPKLKPEGGAVLFSLCYQGKTFSRAIEPAYRKNFEVFFNNTPFKRKVTLNISQGREALGTISFAIDQSEQGLYTASREENGEFTVISEPLSELWGYIQRTGMHPINKPTTFGVENDRPFHEGRVLNQFLTLENRTDKIAVLTLTLLHPDHSKFCVAMPIALRPWQTKHYPKDIYALIWKSAHKLAKTKKSTEPLEIAWITSFVFAKN